MEHVGFPHPEGPAMPTLVQVYEQHSEECIRSAAETDDPKQRAMLLKLASEWREDAKALLRVAESAPSGAPAQVRRKALQALNGDSQPSVELYEPQEMQRIMRG